MRLLLPFLKGHIKKTALIALLLILQAVCELTLPFCMAEMIDTGIGQSGITTVVPETFGSQGMERLFLVMSESEQQQVLQYYQQEANADGQPIYRLRECSEDEQAQLASLMSPAMVAVYALSTDGADYSEILGEDLYVPRGIDTFGLLSLMPQDARDELTRAARERIAEVPESLVTQAAVNFVRTDLAEQGVDVDAMQRTYLVARGVRMLAAALGLIVFSLAAAYFISGLAAGFACELRQALFEESIGMKDVHFAKFSEPELLMRIMGDVHRMEQFASIVLRVALYVPVLSVGAALAAGSVVPVFGGLLFILAVFAGILTILLVRFASAGFRRLCNAETGYRKKVRELLDGMAHIRAFGTEDREKTFLHEKSLHVRDAAFRANVRLSILSPAFLLLMNGGFVLAAWYGVTAINAGALRVGGLAAVFQYVMITMDAFLTVSMLTSVFPEASACGDRVKEILLVREHEEEQMFSAEMYEMIDTYFADGSKRELPASKAPAIEFREVSFAWSEEEAQVLQKVSFTVDYGTVTAVVGAPGSGKSTLLKLIPALYEPTQGSIWIDGKEATAYEKEKLRAKIGYVEQDPFLFAGTAQDNIRMGKENAAPEEVIAAAKIAQADEFLEEKGYGMQITPGGNNLSGGQKQRLSIARALVRRASILLLDDCFSALDPGTAARLRAALTKTFSSAAVLFVTQQVDAAKWADQILVLDQGHLLDMGTHEALMQRCSIYRQMAEQDGEEMGI